MKHVMIHEKFCKRGVPTKGSTKHQPVASQTLERRRREELMWVNEGDVVGEKVSILPLSNSRNSTYVWDPNNPFGQHYESSGGHLMCG